MRFLMVFPSNLIKKGRPAAAENASLAVALVEVELKIVVLS